MIEIVVADKTIGENRLDQVQNLFSEMYAFMAGRNLQIGLGENGAALWCAGIVKLLGKVNHLVLATDNGQVIGFASGNIRISPSYLGGIKTGFISHLYVKPDFRKQKIASDLTHQLEACLLKQEIHSIELDVLCENAEALKFWQKMGYCNELIKMRKN